MRKIFTLLVMLMSVIGYANAESYEWVYDNGATVIPSETKFFTTAGNANARYAATYVAEGGTKYVCAKPLKLDSSGKLSFTTSQPASFIIVIPKDNTDNKKYNCPKLNSKTLDEYVTDGKAAMAENPTEGDVNVKVLLLSDKIFGGVFQNFIGQQ